MSTESQINKRVEGTIKTSKSKVKLRSVPKYLGIQYFPFALEHIRKLNG